MSFPFLFLAVLFPIYLISMRNRMATNKGRLSTSYHPEITLGCGPTALVLTSQGLFRSRRRAIDKEKDACLLHRHAY